MTIFSRLVYHMVPSLLFGILLPGWSCFARLGWCNPVPSIPSIQHPNDSREHHHLQCEHIDVHRCLYPLMDLLTYLSYLFWCIFVAFARKHQATLTAWMCSWGYTGDITMVIKTTRWFISPTSTVGFRQFFATQTLQIPNSMLYHCCFFHFFE